MDSFIVLLLAWTTSSSSRRALPGNRSGEVETHSDFTSGIGSLASFGDRLAVATEIMTKSANQEI